MKDGKRCLLLVDDEIRILRGTKDYLERRDFYVLTASDGEEALRVYEEKGQYIDMVLLDVLMPLMDGYQVLEVIRESSEVPVIMVTAKGEDYDQVKGFSKGVDDYIIKPVSLNVLLLRIEAVLKRAGVDADARIEVGTVMIQRNKRKAYKNGELLELTRREFDLLEYFMVNLGVTVTREQILDKVWGYHFEGNLRTVDTHVKQLRMKLGSEQEFIHTVYRVGYCMEVPK